MRIHSLFHVPFEGLGTIKEWIDLNNHILSCTKLYYNETCPSLKSFDVLIIMGGSMSVNDEHSFPWLKAEKEFIRSAINSNKKIIGICLGAQLLANCLGSPVYKNTKKEIGWFPIQKTFCTNPLFPDFNIREDLTVFHWHGETFDLPSKSIRLFESKVTPNQGFLFDDRVIGLQFHLEMNRAFLSKLIKNCKDEIIPDDFIQTEKVIMNSLESNKLENKNVLFNFFNSFL
jgi:GMP synthase-like glutamine amidotransferase